MTWKEKYRRDPDLAESIIETLRQDLKDAECAAVGSQAQMWGQKLEELEDEVDLKKLK